MYGLSSGFFVWLQGSWVSWGCETQPFVEFSDGLIFGKRHRVIASCVSRKAHLVRCFVSHAGFASSAFLFGPLEAYVMESVGLDHGLMFEHELVYKDYRRLATHLFSISTIDLKYWKWQTWCSFPDSISDSTCILTESPFLSSHVPHICRKTKPTGVSESAKTVTLAPKIFKRNHFSK